MLVLEDEEGEWCTEVPAGAQAPTRKEAREGISHEALSRQREAAPGGKVLTGEARGAEARPPVQEPEAGRDRKSVV